MLLAWLLACSPDPAGGDHGGSADPGVPGADETYEGFGADTQGGTGGEVVYVTSLAHSGAGSLRSALDGLTGPTIVRFQVDGVIASENTIEVPSFVTIDATGRDVTLSGGCLRLKDVAHVIVRNLSFQDCGLGEADAIQITDNAHDVVVSHCSFDSSGLTPFVEDVPDELISVVWGSHDVTVEWSRFSNHDKVLLFGNGDAPADTDEAIAVTLHHNAFVGTGRRHPFLRYGRVDAYDNVIMDWTEYLEEPYGMRALADGEILAEANWFSQSNEDWPIAAYAADGGKLRLVDDVLAQDWLYAVEASPDEVFERPYDAEIEPADATMRDTVLEWAGATL